MCVHVPDDAGCVQESRTTCMHPSESALIVNGPFQVGQSGESPQRGCPTYTPLSDPIINVIQGLSTRSLILLRMSIYPPSPETNGSAKD
ncbi:hypothetical protein GDO78_020564 [Eleutherodactylus coqui]|uniref:Uncharacterized protein n=1 Tax=Eleutherodactylus coqui TaxID=57060 RepID=A0A8J6JPD8_ELECQ|nr:hypothetical protein GDO78_020564 [Eleutherodactylus coqui]